LLLANSNKEAEINYVIITTTATTTISTTMTDAMTTNVTTSPAAASIVMSL
jgi:hypothetical protein